MEVPSEWKVHYVVKLQASGSGEACPPSALGGDGQGPRERMPRHPRAGGFSLQYSSTSCRAPLSPVRVEGEQLDPVSLKGEDEALRSHVGRPLLLRPGRPFPPSSSSLGWLRRHASCRSLERRSLSSRRFSSSSCESLLRLSRSSSGLFLSVMLPLPPRWSAHPRRRLTICLAPLPMSPAQRTPDPRPPDL